MNTTAVLMYLLVVMTNGQVTATQMIPDKKICSEIAYDIMTATAPRGIVTTAECKPMGVEQPAKPASSPN